MIEDTGSPLGPGLLRELLARGLAGEDEVLAGDLVLRDLSRRNANVLVARRHGRSHFLKVAPGPEQSALLAREAAALGRIEAGGVAGIVPALHQHDREGGLLVTEGVPEAEDLKSVHAREEGYPPDIGRLVGAGLAEVHDATSLASAIGPSPQVPWALSLHRPTVEALGELTPGSLDLVRTIQSEPAIGRALDTLRRAWRPRALVHNDLKWENVLLLRAGETGSSIRIVDWEYAADGEPLWDVGSAIASYLSSWVWSIDTSRGGAPEELPQHARRPMEAMADAVGALWRAYLGRRGLEDPYGDLATQATRMAGARLLVAAHETTQSGTAFRSHLVLHVQLAANLLARPHEALEVLGLHAHAPA